MTESVLTIGTFDGVHLGHAALIAKARAIGDSRSPRARVVAAAFFPHPMSRLNPAAEPAMLNNILRFREEAGDHTRTSFQWEVFLLAGDSTYDAAVPAGQLFYLGGEREMEPVVALMRWSWESAASCPSSCSGRPNPNTTP